MTDNYIDPENFADGYNKSINGLKNNPEVVELDRLCYEVFNSTEDGKALIDLFKSRFLIPTFVHPNAQDFPTQCVYYEGFKQAFRMIINSVNAHQQRIDAENHKND